MESIRLLRYRKPRHMDAPVHLEFRLVGRRHEVGGVELLFCQRISHLDFQCQFVDNEYVLDGIGRNRRCKPQRQKSGGQDDFILHSFPLSRNGSKLP